MADTSIQKSEVTTAVIPEELVDSMRENVEAARSPNTRKAYDGDWRRFVEWCQEHGLEPLPAEPAAIALYITHLADLGRKVTTIRRSMVSISQAHKLAGHESPTIDGKVCEVFKGIRNRLGTAPKKARPIFPEELRRAYPKLGDDLRAVRNKAMLNVGFGGGFRRSELVGLNFEDVEFVDEGIVVTLRRSKTDQEAEGHVKGIPFGQYEATCPVRSLQAWLEAASITDGPLFCEITPTGELTERRMSPQAVTRAVKRVAKLAGLDRDLYSAHSLRAGFVTAAAREGKRMDRIMSQTGHRSEKVVRGYVREGELWRDNASEGIGL